MNYSASEEEAGLPDKIALERDVAARLKGFDNHRRNLIPILQDIQDHFLYLAPEAILMVAEHIGIGASEVYGVATFYNQFRFHPPGRHPIKVCLGTACHVRGGDIILENFERKLGISDGETTTDREFSIERVACVGCCALAPVAVVDENIQGHMAPSKVEGIVLGYKIERDRIDRERENEPGEPA
ncbi:Respiratory-chain NADH dehydrogenase 24 Kd subunit [uncultured Desulfobacterium sp.]|uniref:Respiratory-chain NADH dehydrogenase 24 Kd subunit n=1 Tax=uncultured Desulfobacterium sp. TaxID=201089 RepID=A0A445MT58_9BACT|nr:Respiratory-chain NADH dehydrogenase 24 Kd subunit [uncultured Desulfobacterium sp.]